MAGLDINEPDDCKSCQLQNRCGHSKLDFPKHHFSTISAFIKRTMQYRYNGFYSFRGHRNREWELGVKFRFKDINDEDLAKRIEMFRRRCLSLPLVEKIDENDEWRWMFFAQHYGLITKLLDWSSNPLVALYFAVENIVSRQKDNVPGCVWGLKVENAYFQTPKEVETPQSPTDWLMINPPPITKRIESQSGKFSYHPDPKKLITDTENNQARSRDLVLFCVEGNNLRETNKNIRKQLGIMNIHHASMFPDPGGIASFLNQEISSLDPDWTDPAYEQ